MPSKVRILLLDGQMYRGAKARARLAVLVEQAKKQFPEQAASLPAVAKHPKVLAHIFNTLKKSCEVLKGARLYIWREREHIHRATSSYKQFCDMFAPNKPPKKAEKFYFGQWIPGMYAWAIPILQAAGFVVVREAPVAQCKWYIDANPPGWPYNTVYIQDGKVMDPWKKNVPYLVKKPIPYVIKAQQAEADAEPA
jgi:hypothetical protein